MTKIKLQLDTNFKSKVFECFKDQPDIIDILSYLGSNDINALRQAIEDYMDQDDLKIEDKLVDSGDMAIVNAKIEKMNELRYLYAYLIDNYNICLDESAKIMEKVQNEN